jgi:two-component system copper resistance phosphate regulon response regulator CusR
MKILVVEDDLSLAEIIRVGLTSEDHIVEMAADGGNGSFLGRTFEFDAIILDYSLPKKDGLVVCREIRAAGKTTPIIFLSATEDPETKIAALDSGADDYMTKPFVLQELYARIRALSRRPTVVNQATLSVHDLTLDIDRHMVMRGTDQIRTTRKEFNLLEYFMKHAGTVLSRSLIMEHVWTADSNPFSNTVEAHIRNLRKKINAGDKPNLIANVPGRGYMIDTPENVRRLAHQTVSS